MNRSGRRVQLREGEDTASADASDLRSRKGDGGGMSYLFFVNEGMYVSSTTSFKTQLTHSVDGLHRGALLNLAKHLDFLCPQWLDWEVQHFERVHIENVHVESVHFESVRFESLLSESLHFESVQLFESVHSHQKHMTDHPQTSSIQDCATSVLLYCLPDFALLHCYFIPAF